MDAEISQNPLGCWTRDTHLRAFDLNILPYFFSFDPSWVLPFPKWRNGKKAVKLDLELALEKEAENDPSSSSFPSSPKKKYHIHPEIWYYANKPVMPIANWALSTWFMSIKDIFVCSCPCCYRWMPLSNIHKTALHTQSSCLHWYLPVSEADFKPVKKTDDLLGKCGKTPDSINSRNTGQTYGYCGWEFRSSLQIFYFDLFCK